jgi:Tfp pilus assembly protein PilV
VSPADARRGRGTAGFVLTEVMVALLVLVVGLLGAAGLLRLAAWEMARAVRAEAARWAVTALADSLVGGLASPSGEREEDWGRLRWNASGEGVSIEALEARLDGGDGRHLARLWVATVDATHAATGSIP